MSWSAARRWFPPLPGGGPAPRAASVCVASGKGGTGKSVVSASVAALLAEHGRTLIVDADMGIGNAHILQGVSPERSFVEVVTGGLSVPEIVTPCGPRLDLVAAGSGVSHMAGLTRQDVEHIAEGLELLELRYRHLLVDSAAGVSEQTVRFAACCDVSLVVTTPDVTAMTDAYAFLKVLSRARPDARPLLVVNRAHGEPEAGAVAARMESVAQKFLGLAPRWIGWVPEDEAVPRAVNARAPVVAFAPHAPAARALTGVAASVRQALEGLRPRGMGRLLLEGATAPPCALHGRSSRRERRA